MSEKKGVPVFDHMPPELAKAIAERSAQQNQQSQQTKKDNSGSGKKQ